MNFTFSSKAGRSVVASARFALDSLPTGLGVLEVNMTLKDEIFEKVTLTTCSS
ncbi:hypothetical protein [Sphingobacterium sp. ML3W]|uniref:hypothetical protein n=1 Tax=Sphingobacterium sp. ML3W TaxID=1538644 RepID=UPI00130EFBA5|nr:hypothetical protein [Sphingobacterium sp. ML3W]